MEQIIKVADPQQVEAIIAAEEHAAQQAAQEAAHAEQLEQEAHEAHEAEQVEEESENKAETIFIQGEQNSADSVVDTTEDFLKVFQGKTEFDSWEEFSLLFEEFQRVTGSSFKPKSATSIEYANERRVKDKIADRFVYQTVKMVCHNFGEPVRRETIVKKTKKYIGLGCEAMVHLRYKSGTLGIVSCNLEHKNHSLHQGNEIISVRSFSFTDDVDFLIAKACRAHNPFRHWNSEKQWGLIVEDLQRNEESNLKTVTIRMVKKRIRFLMDRFLSNSNGKPPIPGDDMGIVLYELAQWRQESVDNPPKRGRGRPKKRPARFDDDVMDTEDEHMESLMADMGGDSPSYSPPPGLPPRRPGPKGGAGRNIEQFLNFLQRKDDQDRSLRQTELDLRREELELHKREMELQKNKFDFERVERQAHLDLLKAQLEAFAAAKPKHHELVDAKGDGVTEYTIVVNNEEAFAHQIAQHQVAHQ